MIETNYDIDKDYTKGSLYLGVGLLIWTFIIFALSYLKDDVYFTFGLVGITTLVIIAFVGFTVGLIGLSKKWPKSQYIFDKNKISEYFDEQDIGLLYKSQSYGFSVVLLVLILGYAVNLSIESIPFVWVNLAIGGSIATTNLSYYWLTKDAYDDE